MYDIIPIKKSKRLPVLQEVHGTSLTLSSVALLLSRASVVSEGETEPQGQGDQVYRGSTLVTIDLDADPVDLPCDEAHLEAFRQAAAHSIMFHVGLLRLARREAERRTHPRFVREMRAHTDFRIVDKSLMVDIDIECPLADALGDSRGATESMAR